MSDVVLFEQINCNNQKKIGVITLNSERSLNALSHEMVNKIYPQLKAWQTDTQIAAVFLQGAGEKALCAGGDIVYLYNNLPKENGDRALAIEQFFTDEYELDHLIHTYTKPFIVWGNGIVMGGGLGLMVGASHRIVTESTRIAMPEISIGLYPDVGGSYFLNQMPDNCGLFLGLTGAQINAGDALYTNMADHFVEQSKKHDLLTQLMLADWSDNSGTNNQLVTQTIERVEKENTLQAPDSNVKKYAHVINKVTQHDRLENIVTAIIDETIDDKWFAKAQKTLQKGSPLSAAITYRLLNTSRGLTLAQCFQTELGVSRKCGEFGEFKEGVRALLIDKDNSPAWHFTQHTTVDEDTLNWFFSSPWQEQEHPLANLQK